jgi:hypothetical protein
LLDRQVSAWREGVVIDSVSPALLSEEPIAPWQASSWFSTEGELPGKTKFFNKSFASNGGPQERGTDTLKRFNSSS